MNLMSFLEKVDAVCAKQPKERLAAFIHEWARRLPEEQRGVFLAQLSGDGETKKPLSADAQTLAESGSFAEKCALVSADLEHIAEGGVCVTARINEEYDDWYNNEVDDTIYEDPHGIGPLLDRAVDLVHECMDREAFADAYDIGKEFLELRVSVEDDGLCDYEPLTPFSMRSCELMDRDLRPLILETIYAAYLSLPLEERPKKLYELFELSEEIPVSFENVIQSGEEELPDLPEFLTLWMAHLGEISGRLSQRLFEEAALLLNDRDTAERAAFRYAKVHPGLYEQLLLTGRESEDPARLLALGQEALANVEPHLLVRSRIALLTAENALRADSQEEAERCWLEAFRSDPVPTNYLRLCTECRASSRRREEARGIVQAWRDAESRHSSHGIGELYESSLSDRDSHTLDFLDGAFQKVIAEGMNETTALGWSSTFMKRGLALFLLYLYQGEQLGSGLRYLCERMTGAMSFSGEEYGKGLVRPVSESGVELFWERFRVWRENVPMEEEFQTWILHRIAEWMDLRVEGIMDANRRNYYGECAGFAAALGEVKESRGERGGKQLELLSWCTKYPRRRAFHQELRSFGMKGGK